MNTFPAIEITTTGVFYWPEYPVKPESFEGEHIDTFFGRFNRYEEALKTAIRYHVKNQDYIAKVLYKENPSTIAWDTDDTPIWKYCIQGIYPYDGEVEIEDLCSCHLKICQCLAPKVAILIEPPANVPEKPDSSEPKQEAKDNIDFIKEGHGVDVTGAFHDHEVAAKGIEYCYEKYVTPLRAENKKLNDELGNSQFNVSALSYELNLSIETLRQTQEVNKELVEALKQSVRIAGGDSSLSYPCIPSPQTVDEWKTLISKHYNP